MLYCQINIILTLSYKANLPLAVIPVMVNDLFSFICILIANRMETRQIRILSLY